MGGMEERTTTTAQLQTLPAWTAQCSGAHRGRGQCSPCVPRSCTSLFPRELQTHFGPWGQSHWSHRDEGMWGVQSDPCRDPSLCVLSAHSAHCSSQQSHDFTVELGLNESTWGKVSFLILFPEDTAECDFLACTATAQLETDAVFH